MSTWMLEPLGRIPWDAVRDALRDCTCAWMDLDGLHVDDPPTAIPITTHLWGWSPRRCLRVRTDGDAAYVGVLREDTGVDGNGEPVDVSVRQALMRGIAQTGERASGNLTRLTGLHVELLEIPGPGPVTFVRATPETR